MATDRLRRRVEEAGDDVSSSFENFCQIGTPLPALDAKRDPNEFKPAWQQEVYDEQGRRRFHGAFTGGFSAGYYNTVGSKEGWTPSTFRSSRTEKEKARAQQQQERKVDRVEDFMDEEDLADLRASKGGIRSNDTYGASETGEAQISSADRDPLLGLFGQQGGHTNDQSVQPHHQDTTLRLNSSSLGTTILRRMGWREGEGLGARLTRRARQNLLLLLGLGSDIQDDRVESDSPSTERLAPPDTPLAKAAAGKSLHGLGWEGSARPVTLEEALRRNRHEKKGSASLDARQGGFGVGALENDSDGEDEVYAVGHRFEHSTLNRQNKYARNGDPDKLVFRGESHTNLERDNFWHDGKPMLPGFQIAQDSPRGEPIFASPSLPSGWQPDPQRVWAQASRQIVGKEPQAPNLDARGRANLLGEAKIPGPPPSISDYISAKDRERLERIKRDADENRAVDVKKQSGAQHETSFAARKINLDAEIPKLERSTAKAALQGYMPFAREPEKQLRYRKYLEHQGDPESFSAPQKSASQTLEQFLRELRDFAKSAAIFKPMSTMMANRFESSDSASSQVKQMEPGLHTPREKTGQEEMTEAEKQSQRRKAEEDEMRRHEDELASLTAQRRNARMGLFGPDLTREVRVWKPVRLLCKRFNVPMPYPDERGQEQEGRSKDKSSEVFDEFGESRGRASEMSHVNARWEASKRQLQHLAASRAWELHSQPEAAQKESLAPSEETARPDIGPGRGDNGAFDLTNVGLGEVTTDREDSSFVRPSLDVFKAVFADDEERVLAAPGSGHLAEKETTSTQLTRNKSEEVASPSQPAAAQEGPPKLTFIPRKRRQEAEEIASAVESGKQKEKRKPNSSKKKKSSGLLTFSMDDDDG